MGGGAGDRTNTQLSPLQESNTTCNARFTDSVVSNHFPSRTLRPGDEKSVLFQIRKLLSNICFKIGFRLQIFAFKSTITLAVPLIMFLLDCDGG